jgi:hypothetical protein
MNWIIKYPCELTNAFGYTHDAFSTYPGQVQVKQQFFEFSSLIPSAFIRVSCHKFLYFNIRKTNFINNFNFIGAPSIGQKKVYHYQIYLYYLGNLINNFEFLVISPIFKS